MTVNNVNLPMELIQVIKTDEVQDSDKKQTVYADTMTCNLEKFSTNKCNRCKKDFAQMGPKPFKMCEHCRILQRERSKRWKVKTKNKEGVCTRCGTELPQDSIYVMCEHCRGILRSGKANRFLEGRCVHCSGPNSDEGVYKVCRKCREKDKIRRLTLEQEGLCNRCSMVLPREREGHKVCISCRIKKKSYTTSNQTDLSLSSNPVRNIDETQLYTTNNISKDSTISDTDRALASEIAHYATQANNNNIIENISATTNIDDDNELMNDKVYIQAKRALEDDKLDYITKRKHSENYQDITIDNDNIRHNVGNDDLNENTEFNHDGITNYEDHILLSNNSKTLDENMLLSETFNIHHDHSQLNQQLKQLSQFTRHSVRDDGNSKYVDQSVLVDLNGLEDIGIDYDINVDDDDEVEGGREDDSSNNDANNAEDEEEKETMLRHVRAVQAGLLSNTAEQSDAEMEAAVEAVAVAAAVARGRGEKNE